MNIGVLGGGSLGLLWAARLAGIFSVSVITRTDGQADVLHREGIRLITQDGAEVHARLKAFAFGRAIEYPRFDIVLATVKQVHLPGLIPVLEQITHEDSQIIFWQNGWGHDEQIRKLNRRPWTYAAVTTEGALRSGPAEVRHTGSGETWIGPFPRQKGQVHPTLEKWLFDIRRKLPGTSIQYDPDILRRIWEKLVINCAINPLTALWEIPNGELLDGRYQSDMKRIVTEAVRVAAAHGVCLDPDEMMEKVRIVCLRTSRNRSSMLQDLKKGVRTEIDYINGAVARLGERAGVKTPFNRELVLLIRQKEAGMV
jgi:2-dehydropantoate 2-reductase